MCLRISGIPYSAIDSLATLHEFNSPNRDEYRFFCIGGNELVKLADYVVAPFDARPH